jgi:hypothetical protein
VEEGINIPFETNPKVILTAVETPSVALMTLTVNFLQVKRQLDSAKSHFIHAARSSISELYNLDSVVDDDERAVHIERLLQDNDYIVRRDHRGHPEQVNTLPISQRRLHILESSQLFPGGRDFSVHLHPLFSPRPQPW